jgi:hypothetical protein
MTQLSDPLLISTPLPKPAMLPILNFYEQDFFSLLRETTTPLYTQSDCHSFTSFIDRQAVSFTLQEISFTVAALSQFSLLFQVLLRRSPL